MKARDIMNTRVTAATPRAVARDLALQLLSGMYSGLPVVDSKSKVVGVVTEFDLLNAIRQGRDMQTTKADEIMTKPAICVREDEDIEIIAGPQDRIIGDPFHSRAILLYAIFHLLVQSGYRLWIL